MKRILSLILALMLGLSCFSALGESFASDYAAMNEAAASVLVLTLYDENEKELGTASGFIAFDESHAVTTWLAVSSAARIAIETDEGEKLGSFKVLGCDSDCNLAILAFDEPTGLKPLALNQTGNVRRGAACVSIGAQNGVNSITTGHVATTFSVQGLDLIQFTATISEGSSGGALLDENGQVAAVTMFGISGEIGYTVLQNMNFALSVSHLMTLWEFCKDDEPVEMKELDITDISADPVAPVSDKITFINDTGYSIVTMRLYKWRGPNQGTVVITKDYTWIKKGESVEITLKEDDIQDPNLPVTIEMTLNVGGNHTKVNKSDIPIGELLGKTISLTYTAYPSNLTLSFLNDGESISERRHTKDDTGAEDDFEIPEVIERERANPLPKNLCIIINDTELLIDYVVITNNADFRIEIKPTAGEPSDYCIVELPERFVNNNGKQKFQFSLRLKNNPGLHPYITTNNQDEICGKMIHVKYDEANRKFYLEAE